MSTFDGELLTIRTLLRKYSGKISITWLLTLIETALMTLIPLFIGFAIDGLLSGELASLSRLAMVLGALIAVSVVRRVYDTRAYGTIRVDLGGELIARSSEVRISRQNAQLGMARELVDFLEEQVPALMNSVVQLVISFAVLFLFDPILAYAALAGAVSMIVIYGLFHRRFYRLNGYHNQQTEKQVGILEAKMPDSLAGHLQRIRHVEVKLSDTEAYVYGAIFVVLMGFILFNLWFAATNMTTTAGTIFAIISYSWEFVESALIIPATVQGWSRLSEITQRINRER